MGQPREDTGVAETPIETDAKTEDQINDAGADSTSGDETPADDAEQISEDA